mgnify:CR=1 FL=1
MGEESPDQLLANPSNFRIHPAMQQAALEGSLDTLGWVQQVLVNKQTGHVIDGHLRIALALRHHQPLVPVLYVDLTEDEERQALLSLDPVAAMAATDRDKLDALLRSVQSDDERVQAMMREIAERERIPFGPEPPEDPGAQIDRAEELREKWGVELGQLWEVGKHRIICGDCTDRAVVERVMQGEKAQLLMADPPYNVKYTGGSTNDQERPDSYDDDMNDKDYTNWLNLFLKYGFDFSDDKTALLLWFASAKTRSVIGGFEGAGWISRTLIVWNKLNAHYGALGAQYKHKFEPMWYCYKKSNSPRFFGATNETTVWDFEQPYINDLHPTMKPIELYEKCINNHSENNNIVLELFLGSGTTLVACERLNRIGRGVEISPAYVAVSLQRLADMGLEPKLVE